MPFLCVYYITLFALQVYQSVLTATIFTPPLRSQASIEVREAGKRAVTQIQQQGQQQQQTVGSAGPATPNLLQSANDPAATFAAMSADANDSAAQPPHATDSTNSTNSATAIPLSPPPPTILSILHFNDVYNIDSNTNVEPIGGAARFCTAIKSLAHLDPLVLFSGDAFSPSMRKCN